MTFCVGDCHTCTCMCTYMNMHNYAIAPNWHAPTCASLIAHNCWLGHDPSGNPVYLRDIWPTREQIHAVEQKHVLPAMFKEVYSKITNGNLQWNSLDAPDSLLYPWDDKSTYIKSPPFFAGMTLDLPHMEGVKNAHALLNLGDSVTTDHISPAGSISRNSPAARYLASRG